MTACDSKCIRGVYAEAARVSCRPMHIADRVAKMAESSTLAATARGKALAAKGFPVLSLSAGEPDFATPANIVEAAIEGLRRGLTHYAPTAGTADAREAVARKLRDENGLACEAAGTTITVGAKHAIFLALQTLLEPGDEVLLPVPAWVSYAPIVELAGGRVVEVPARPDRGYLVSAEDLERAITSQTRAIVFNSPINPTGTMYSPDSIREIAAMLARHPGISIVADEIYEKLVYPEIDPAASFLSIGACPEVAERTITVNGMSKAFAMTGWRIGYAAGVGEGAKAVREMIKLQGQMTNGIPTFCMPAIVEALSNSADSIESMRRSFAARARIVAEGLGAIADLTAPTPTSAFYAFIDLGRVLGRSSPAGRRIESPSAFCEALLEESYVAAVPGEDFGGPGRTAFRISFACAERDLREALDRLRVFVENMSKA
jgi:aspartate aminotransferase